ncbi:MAG: hypothetical protein IAE90_03630 [Ignavibacteria bacterium]|nr:hypothetical protein [Ignavibacteria bacterium]
MSTNTLQSLLSSLTVKETAGFRDFLNSPYFNRNEKVVKLYDILMKHVPQESSKHKLEDLHRRIFKAERYNRENIKTIIYLLTRLAEQFLVTTEFRKDDAEYNRRLLKIFNRKGLDKHFLRHLRKCGFQVLDEGNVELDKISRKAEFEKTLLQFYLQRNDEKNIFAHERNLSDDLIAAFLVDMFKQYNVFWRAGYLENLLETEFTSAVLDSVDFERLFSTFSEKNYRYYMLLLPHYSIYRLLKDGSGSIDIESLRQNIAGNEFISGNEKFVLSTILVNAVYFRSLKSGGIYSREVFEALKLMIELYEFSEDQYLRYTTYSNVLRVALQNGEYTWTEEFINKYHVLLEPSIKDNMLIYSNAYLAFSRGDFEKCLEYESKINFQTFQQRYYLRDLRLSSLYELGKYENALSLIDSYKHFIKNDGNYTSKMKHGYLLFLTFINDLIRLKLGLSRKNAAEVKEKLTNSLPMRKDWLIKKFEEIAES